MAAAVEQRSPDRKRSPVRRRVTGAGPLAAIALGIGLVACAASDQATAPKAEPTTATTPGTLPVGETNSPYWVAHDLPPGYSIVSAEDVDDPLTGQLPAHRTTYHDGGGDDFDAALAVTTIEGDPLEKFSPAEVEQSGFVRVQVRGHDGLRYPLRDDGEDYGTSLLWEERAGLWMLVEAAEPLTGADATATAEGLQPFPAERWADLGIGVDIMGAIDPESVEGFISTEVGSGTDGTVGWTLDVLVPPRFGQLPGDRRTSCAQLRVDGQAIGDRTCASHPSWVEHDAQVFVIGSAPKTTNTITVETSSGSVEAERFAAPGAMDVQYWVAPLGAIECGTVQVSFRPSDPKDDLTVHMTGETGPGAGCGQPGALPTAPGG